MNAINSRLYIPIIINLTICQRIIRFLSYFIFNVKALYHSSTVVTLAIVVIVCSTLTFQSLFQCLPFQVPSRQDGQRQLGQPRLPEDHHGAWLRRKTGRCGSEVRQPSVGLKGLERAGYPSSSREASLGYLIPSSRYYETRFPLITDLFYNFLYLQESFEHTFFFIH